MVIYIQSHFGLLSKKANLLPFNSPVSIFWIYNLKMLQILDPLDFPHFLGPYGVSVQLQTKFSADLSTEEILCRFFNVRHMAAPHGVRLVVISGQGRDSSTCLKSPTTTIWQQHQRENRTEIIILKHIGVFVSWGEVKYILTWMTALLYSCEPRRRRRCYTVAVALSYNWLKLWSCWKSLACLGESSISTGTALCWNIGILEFEYWSAVILVYIH